MRKSNRVRSADALYEPYCAQRGTLTDERIRAMHHRSQDQRAQRVRDSIYRLYEIAEEILAEGGD